MSDLSIRARTVSELVDGAIALYRRDALSYITITAIMSVPGLLFQLGVTGVNDPASFTFGIGWIFLLIVSICTYALMNGAVMHMGATVYLGGQADVAQSIRVVLPKVPALILGTILRVPLYFLGVLVFGVGLVYAFVRWYAVDPVIVLEGKGALESFGRSSQLTQDRKWEVFKAIFLGFLIYWVIAIGVSIVGAVVDSPVVLLVLQTMTTVVVYPMIGLLLMLLYYDARVRDEAFDVQHLEASLGSLPAR